MKKLTLALMSVIAFTCASSASLGPVILAGHDADDHGFEIIYARLFDALRSKVSNGGTGILAIGADPSSTAGNWISTVASLMNPPQQVDFVNGFDILLYAFNPLIGQPHAILFIPSDSDDTVGGITVTDDGYLKVRKDAIAAFVNGGGGLFGLTQGQFSDPFGYLAPLYSISILSVPPSGLLPSGEVFDSVSGTSAGAAFGITDSSLDGCCWHNVFVTFPGKFTVLATADEPYDPDFDGRPALIGLLPGKFTVLDGTDLSIGEAITSDPEVLARAGTAVGGVVADGVTQLLLRMEVSDTTPDVTFSLTSANLGDGGLRTVGSIRPLATSLTVPTQLGGGKRWAFAVYTSPTNFSSTPTTQTSRDIELQAVPRNLAPVKEVRTIYRPPVVLVHGVWSSPSGAWQDTGFERFLANAQFEVTLADYGRCNNCEFNPRVEANPPVQSLIDAIKTAKEKRRASGIAVTQVDVVAHSMGGLVARARVVFASQPYLNKSNFMKGDIHKLITIGTPHKGTALANWLVENSCDCMSGLPIINPRIRGLMDFLGRPLGSAIVGFQTNSAALAAIGATTVPSHAIVGIAPDNSDTEDILNRIPSFACHQDITIDRLLGGNGKHDTIVPTNSQTGGLTGDAVTEVRDIVHAGFGDDIGETASFGVATAVTDLLRSAITLKRFGSFAPLIPQGTPSQLTTCPTTQCPSTCPNMARSQFTLASAASAAATVSLVPSPGTFVRPGDTIRIDFSVVGGNAVEGVLVAIGDRFRFIDGLGPFSFQWTVRSNLAGRVEIFVGTFGSGPDNYSASTFVVVNPAAQITSLRVSEDVLDFYYSPQQVQLHVRGSYTDGVERDVTGPDSGTSYRALSGTTTVAEVTSDGLVSGRGNGQDVIFVSNSGITNAVLVRVQIHNHRPVLNPVGDRVVRAGSVLDLPISATDADSSNAVSFSAATLPAFATLRDNGNGTGVIRLAPGINDTGTYPASINVLDDGVPRLGASEQINITVLPSILIKGAYNGLFFDTNSVRHQSSGFFSAKTTARGTFSAKTLLAGRRYSWSGQFNVDGKATNVIARTGFSPLTVELSLELGGDHILGNVRDVGWTAELLAYRAAFNPLTNAASQAGKFTMIIPGDVDSTTSPAGDGFGAVTVDAAGKIGLKGTLADGTKFGQRTFLSQNGQGPLYVSLYHGQGSILSWITFTNGAMDDLNGVLSWIKPSLPTAKYYPAGFTNETDVIGSKYVPPAIGSRVLNFSAGQVKLAGGNLPQSFTNMVSLGTDNKVTNLSSNKLTLTVALPTGLFKGKVADPMTGKTIPFQGAVLQRVNLNYGTGYFLGTNQSGLLLLQGN